MRTLLESAEPELQGDLLPASGDGFADLQEACARAAEAYDMEVEEIARGLALCLARALKVEALKRQFDIRHR
jgi:hypothetical protein